MRAGTKAQDSAVIAAMKAACCCPDCTDEHRALHPCPPSSWYADDNPYLEAYQEQQARAGFNVELLSALLDAKRAGEITNTETLAALVTDFHAQNELSASVWC